MKYFKVKNDLYVCDDSTPIPSITEVINRFHTHLDCLYDNVVEITHKEFLRLHHELLKEITKNSKDAKCWAPNLIHGDSGFQKKNMVI